MKIRTSIIKLILDLMMFITFMLLYSKNVISLRFHELAGFVVLLVVFIHVSLNGKWVNAVTRRIFDKTIPSRTKFLWAVDLFLLLFTIALLVTGLLISKVVFKISGGHNFLIPYLFFIAAVFLILLGIHIGFHFKYIKNIVSKKREHRTAGKITAIVAAVLIAGAGVYSISTTSYGKWLIAPFSSSQSHGTPGMQKGQGNPYQAQNNRPPFKQEISAKRIAGVFGTTLSIALLFGIITFTIDELIRKKNETNL